MYSSPWYSAVYLLLFVSLIGCILPRIRVHARALVSRPPRTPSRLDRMVGHERLTVAATPVDVIEAADRRLARRHYRRARFDTAATSRRPAALSVSAERGYLRETGNLVFHVALVGVLVAVGVGGGLSYHGQRVIVQGDTFPNTLSSYDSFTPGQWFDAGRLAPFSITLDGFRGPSTPTRSTTSAAAPTGSRPTTPPTSPCTTPTAATPTVRSRSTSR